jgi:hypothetical protein
METLMYQSKGFIGSREKAVLPEGFLKDRRTSKCDRLIVIPSEIKKMAFSFYSQLK